MTAELLTVSDLRVGFATDSGVARVLDHVNFRMGRGEIVGLVGESGCGKTTLARTILGVLPGSARVEGGPVTFDGEDLLTMDRLRFNAEIRGRAITFVPQDPYSSFNPVFTVGTQIMELMRWKSPNADPAATRQSGAFGDVWHGYPKARREADRRLVVELLTKVQLPQPDAILRKYPHELSGGQRQRVMIAMALLPSPKLIIADEPTTALDVTIQAQILRLLRDLATERGVSVLFTTHDLGTAYEICDQVTVMYAGQEVEAAPTESFFTRPTHPYTRALIDSLPSTSGQIAGIPGEIPSLVRAPGGCRFHPRCPNAGPECPLERPATTFAGERHWVRCFHPVGGAPGAVPSRQPEAAS